MSVERRGDNNFSTVQRRGEKRTILPTRDYTSPEYIAGKASRTEKETAAPYRVTLTGKDMKGFEEKVARRVAELEADPQARKEFLKKVEGWSGKIIFALILLFAVPPLMFLVLPFALYYFLKSAAGVHRQSPAALQDLFVSLAVANRLKGKKSGKFK